MAEDRWLRVLSLGPTEFNRRGERSAQRTNTETAVRLDWKRCCTTYEPRGGPQGREPPGGGRRYIYRFLVVIEKDKDGYFAFTPQLQGCYTQGDTYEEVLENIRDAIRLHVEDRLDSGEEVPQPEAVSLTSLEVAV